MVWFYNKYVKNKYYGLFTITDIISLEPSDIDFPVLSTLTHICLA